MTDVQTAQNAALDQLKIEFGWWVGPVPPCVYAAALHVSTTGQALGKLGTTEAVQVIELRQPYVDVYVAAFAAIEAATTVSAVQAVTWAWPASA